MNEEEFAEMQRKVETGLAIAHERMLKEKALRDESIVVYDPETDSIVRIKARDIISEETASQRP